MTAPTREGSNSPTATSAPLVRSGVGRLGRFASVAALTALGSAWGRMTGRSRDGWDALDPAAIARLVRTLGELKGLPMKLGQILSFADETLPPEARRLLAQLQTQSAQLPLKEVQRVVRDELGSRATDLLATMEPTPMAAASIGQVHRARLPSGTQVAVKVQYPGIEEALRSELQAAAVGVHAVRALMPGLALESYVSEVRERLLAECDYEQEARSQSAFLERLRSHPVLRVPEVHGAYTSRRVLTTTWHDGVKLEVWLSSEPSLAARSRAGLALYEFYIGSLYRYGLFNADPHPGNYLFTADTVVLLDFGCVRAFAPERVAALIALRDAVLFDDENAIRAALVGLGAADPKNAKVYAIARRLLRGFFAPMLEDRVTTIKPAKYARLGALLSDKRSILELGLPADLLFLFRIKFGVYAVLAQLGAEANWQKVETSWRSDQTMISSEKA
jgi:predicted unusual protein kinase regulating ubiquinone biosynthesis (AarF/ABC1/UbiB family)